MNMLKVSAWPIGEESTSSALYFPEYYWLILAIPVIVFVVWLILRNKGKGQK
jgi:hypothetical protein